MADLAITPANVLAMATASTERSIAGATILAGQVVYKEAATGQYKLAGARSGIAEAKIPYAIALDGAATGQPLIVLTGGPITIGATVVAGTAYYLSHTAGGIKPVADLASTDLVTLIGIATSTTVIDVRIHQSGVTL